MRPGLLAALVAGAVGVAAGAAVLVLRDGDEPAPWRYGQAMSQRRSYIAAAEVDGRIYAAGGMVGETGRPLATLQRYDPAENAWTTLEPLPRPVRAAAAAAIGRTIYVVGGSGADDGRRLVAYDVDADRWSERAPLPEPRQNHAAVAFGSRLYVLGGFDGGRILRSVEVYDPVRDRWRPGPALPERLHAFGALVFRGELWVIGGRHDQAIVRTVWILDPASGRWRRGPAMPKPMELLGVAAAGDEIHAVWESTYQVYDAGTGRWSDGPRPLVTRHALEAFTVGGTLYTVGGCTTQLRDSPVVERRRVSRARGASRSPFAGSRSSPRRSPGSSGRGRGARSRTRP